MFNLGPGELLVLALVGLIVLGPERLPGLARDAARMLRTLRDLAQGAHSQLRDELGPEFADVDLRNLNPRTAIQRAVLGDDLDLGFDLGANPLNPKQFLRDTILGPEQKPETGSSRGSGSVSLSKTGPDGAATSGPTPGDGDRPSGSAADVPFDPDTT